MADPDDELAGWLDAPPATGSYRYRLAAWSAFGRSAHAYTPAVCAVRAVQRQPLLPAQLLPTQDVQALLASLAAAGGGSLSARPAVAGGSSSKAWSWSAASSAVVVALTILLKASQLRVGARLAALWQLAVAALSRRWHAGGQAPASEQQEHSEVPRPGSPPHLPAGMRRSSSSHASLAALGGEAAAPGRQEQQQQREQLQQQLGLLGSGSLLHGWSSSQLLSLESSQAEGLALDPAAALSAEDAADSAAAEQLAQAIQRGQHCGHPGCHRRFDRLRDMRRKLEVGAECCRAAVRCWLALELQEGCRSCMPLCVMGL